MAKEETEPKKENNEPENWFIDPMDGKELTEEEFCQFASDQASNHPVVKNHHGKWRELIAWCDKGEQFSLWDGAKRRVIPVELSQRKKKVVINLMKPLVEAIESKINLYYKVMGQPNSSEQMDIRGAEVAGRLIDYNDYINAIEDIFEENKYDFTRTGNACQKWAWDASSNGKAKIKKDGDARTVPGEVIGESIPIFNIRPDPLAKNPKKMRWIIEVIPTTKQEIKDKFLSYKRVTAQDIDSIAETETKKDPTADDEEPESLAIKLFTERPSKAYPKGRQIYSLGNRALYCGPNKNPKGELGYFFFYFKKSPYSFWGIAPLFYVQPIQREFNRTVSLISEHVEAWRPKLAVGQGALKRAGSMTVDSFEIVEVDFSRGEPRPIVMPELSAQVLAWRDFLVSSIDRVSNVHEVSYARLPQYASRAPASLYSMMLEQESMKLDPMVKRTNRTIIDMCKFRLLLMDQHYQEERMVKIVGENRRASVSYFSKADLNENFDVRLEIGVSLNQSTTIQQRLLIELWDKNIIEQSPRNRNKINQWLNLGTAEQSFRTDMADIEKAMRENQAFMDDTYAKERKEGGVQWLIDDDHEIHLEAHVTLLKSEEVAKWEDKRYDDLVKHIEVHRQYYLLAQKPAPTGLGPGQVPPAGPATVEGGEPMIEAGMGPEGT